MIGPLNLGAALYLSQRMAPIFLAERELVRDRYDADAHAVEVYHGMANGVVRLDDDNRPLLAGGLMGTGPGVVHTFMFGAEGWEAAINDLVRHTRKLIKEALTVDAIHRVQCLSPCLHPDAHKFFRLMGLTYECELRGYGKGGESFYMFSRVRDGAPQGG